MRANRRFDRSRSRVLGLAVQKNWLRLRLSVGKLATYGTLALVYLDRAGGGISGRHGDQRTRFRPVGKSSGGRYRRVVGRFLFGLLGLSAVNLAGRLICAFVGAVVLLMLLKFIKRKGA